MMKFTESQTAKNKKSFGKEVIISLVAFANADGGKIIIGLDDSGAPCNVEVGQETIQRYINEIKSATYPPIIPKIEEQTLVGKQILIFEISEYPIKPVGYKNRYYKRIHNSNHIISLDEIVDLQQQSLSLSFDAYPSREPISSLNDKLIWSFFKKIQKRARVTLQDDLLTNLTKLKLVREGRQQ